MQFEELKNSWKRRIKEVGLTQLQFCKYINLNPVHFSKMDNPTIRLCDRIERKLQELEADYVHKV